MLFLTRLFGITGSAAERDLATEHEVVEQIVEKVLLLQAKSATEQHRPLGRGTHVKGTAARALFEVHDVKAGRAPDLGARLAKGIFATPGVYPAIVRFANADPKINSDFKADVRSLSFAVDLTQNGAGAAAVSRQDFSLQNTTTLPLNDATAFLAVMKLLTASNPGAGLLGLGFKDKLRVIRTLALVAVQSHQAIKPYQLLRYGSNTPFRHGPRDIVKFSATPLPGNSSQSLQRSNPNALQDEILRHLNDDRAMSAFEFGVQFLDPARMTYWGKKYDADFWTENASIDWKESQAPFHPVGRLTLLQTSQLAADAAAELSFDVTGNSTPDSHPVGSINRARQKGEVASRQARQDRIARAARESSGVTSIPPKSAVPH
jgi:hypothetical protein